MQLFINNQEAAIPVGTSFEYVQENPLFTEAEGYSFEIELPLKDCIQNQRIFGLINIMSAMRDQLTLPASILDINFAKSGVVAITSVSDVSVKVQFLEGSSVTNYTGLTIDRYYINEIRIMTDWERANPATQVLLGDRPNSKLYTLPWVNNYSGNMQNKQQRVGSRAFATGVRPSYQILLTDMMERIARAIDIQLDLTCLVGTKWQRLLVCNACPAAWNLDDICYAFPHWTVREFFDQVALMVGGAFRYDGSNCKLEMVTTSTTDVVELKNVLDIYDMEVADDAAKDYIGVATVKYADCDHRLWKYYTDSNVIAYARNAGMVVEYDYEGSIQYLIRQIDGITQYYNVADGVALANRYIPFDQTKLHYAKDTGRYYIVTEYTESIAYVDGQPSSIYRKMTVRTLGDFRPLILDENASEKELKIVPAWLDKADNSEVIFLEHGEFGEEEVEGGLLLNTMVGKDEKKQDDFLDKLYVAFVPETWVISSTKYYAPTIDELYNAAGRIFHANLPDVHIDRKYKIKFLSRTIPEVRSIFLINGVRMVCGQIKAKFTTEGKSDLLQGEFYAVR